jgi:hypothetical protein
LFLATLIAGNYEGYELPGDDFPGRYFACWTAAELTATLAGAGFVDVSVVPIDRPQGRADLLATSRR